MGGQLDQIPADRRWVNVHGRTLHDLEQVADYLISSEFMDPHDFLIPNRKQNILLWNNIQELRQLVSLITRSPIQAQKKKNLQQAFRAYQKKIQHIRRNPIDREIMERIAEIGWVYMNEAQHTNYINQKTDEFRRSQILSLELSEMMDKIPQIRMLTDKNGGEIFGKKFQSVECAHGKGAYMIGVYLFWWWKVRQTTPLSPLFIMDGDVKNESVIVYTTRCLQSLDTLMPRLLDLPIPNTILVPEEFRVDDAGAVQFWKSRTIKYASDPKKAWDIMNTDDGRWWRQHRVAVYDMLADVDEKIEHVRVVTRLPPRFQRQRPTPIIRGQSMTYHPISQTMDGQRSDDNRFSLSTADLRRALSDIKPNQANNPQLKRLQIIRRLKQQKWGETLDDIMRRMNYKPPYIFFHGTRNRDAIVSIIKKIEQRHTITKFWGEGFYVSPDWDIAFNGYAYSNDPNSKERYMIAFMMTKEDAAELIYGKDFNTNLPNTTTKDPITIFALRDSASAKLRPFLVFRI